MSDVHEVAFVGGIAYGNLEQSFAARYLRAGNDHRRHRRRLRRRRHPPRPGRRAALPLQRLVRLRQGLRQLPRRRIPRPLLPEPAVRTELVNTSWKAGRVVPILDLELGVGWAIAPAVCGFPAGYMVSGWYNVVKTDEWIKAVQANNFVGLSDTMSFDGLVVRGETRF